MATHSFHGKVSFEGGSSSTDGVIKSQLDSGVADAKARANHTGTQTVSTLSDFTTAVDSRIQLIVDSAPSALDTLNELAAALGDDPNFATTIASQLATLDGRIDTLEGATSLGAYNTTIGDNTAATFNITHSLNSTDVYVDVQRLSDGQTVYPVVKRTSVNAVSVDFGATVIGTNTHRVLVRKN